MRGYFAEDMIKHYPAVILHDDMLKGFVGGGCGGTEYGVGDGIGKLLGYYDVGLSGFVIEDLSHIR